MKLDEEIKKLHNKYFPLNGDYCDCGSCRRAYYDDLKSLIKRVKEEATPKEVTEVKIDIASNKFSALCREYPEFKFIGNATMNAMRLKGKQCVMSDDEKNKPFFEAGDGYIFHGCLFIGDAKNIKKQMEE